MAEPAHERSETRNSAFERQWGTRTFIVINEHLVVVIVVEVIDIGAFRGHDGGQRGERQRRTSAARYAVDTMIEEQRRAAFRPNGVPKTGGRGSAENPMKMNF